MSRRVTSLLLVRALSVLSLLILLPLFLSACVWFLSHTDISFFMTAQISFTHFTSSSRASWILYNIGGPILALMLLGLSLALEQEQRTSAFSKRWKRFILLAAGICLLPLIIGFCIHGILGT